jgi:GrpB-like predicted nucleotidyltransferase (UPF0157 family)
VAEEYQRLKMRLAAEYPNNRVAYTRGKTDFILGLAKQSKDSSLLYLPIGPSYCH